MGRTESKLRGSLTFLRNLCWYRFRVSLLIYLPKDVSKISASPVDIQRIPDTRNGLWKQRDLQCSPVTILRYRSTKCQVRVASYLLNVTTSRTHCDRLPNWVRYRGTWQKMEAPRGTAKQGFLTHYDLDNTRPSSRTSESVYNLGVQYFHREFLCL